MSGHDIGTLQAELYARIGVDGVVDAAVARGKAAQHSAVCRIDNSIYGKSGNISLPEIDTWLYRRQVVKFCDASFGKAFGQVSVLYLQKFLTGRGRRTYIHQIAQKPSLIRKGIRHPNVPIFSAFIQQIVDQKVQAFVLRHTATSA